MTCSHCRDVALDIARGVGHAEEAAALEHARACAACSRYLLQQRELTAGLRAMAARTDAVPSETLEQRMLAAFDAGSGPSAASRLRFTRWLEIAAALVLAAGAIALFESRGPVPRNGSPAAGQTAPSPASVAVQRTPEASAANRAQPTVDPQTPAENQAAPPPIRRIVPARSVARPASPRVVQTSGFVSLPDAAMLPPFERGEIVRVQIRLASLTHLGFTVQPDAVDTTPINADLLVGQDGEPRAIRLVTIGTPNSRSRR